MSLIKQATLRWWVFLLGCTSLLVGLVGIVVPLLPTTPFLLLTAWCFYRSSPQAERWLKNNAYLSKGILDWESHGAISRPAKLTASIMLAFSIGVIWYKVDILWLQILVTVFLLAIATFILTRPSR